jgi:NADH dehydrogenase (ubiquinone) 1 alpha/beta subcomplex 1
MSFIRLAVRTAALPRCALAIPHTKNQLLFRAGFSVAAGLSKEVIQSRVLDVLKGFEKVDPTKV